MKTDLTLAAIAAVGATAAAAGSNSSDSGRPRKTLHITITSLTHQQLCQAFPAQANASVSTSHGLLRGLTLRTTWTLCCEDREARQTPPAAAAVVCRKQEAKYPQRIRACACQAVRSQRLPSLPTTSPSSQQACRLHHHPCGMGLHSVYTSRSASPQAHHSCQAAAPRRIAHQSPATKSGALHGSPCRCRQVG